MFLHQWTRKFHYVLVIFIWRRPASSPEGSRSPLRRPRSAATSAPPTGTAHPLVFIVTHGAAFPGRILVIAKKLAVVEGCFTTMSPGLRLVDQRFVVVARGTRTCSEGSGRTCQRFWTSDHRGLVLLSWVVCRISYVTTDVQFEVLYCKIYRVNIHLFLM